MPANINSFASLRVPAWHGLGVVLDTPVPPMEFQAVAGLEWEVSKQELGFGLMAETKGLESFRAVVRSDNNTALGVVGKDYETVQNKELFRFLADLSEFDLEVQVETAGALGKGETVWVLAKVPSLAISLGNDSIESYLLLANGHTGNRKLSVMPTTVRVVCENTLAMAMKARTGTGLSRGFDLKHTVGISDRLAQVQSVLRGVAQTHSQTLETFEALAGVPASLETVNLIADKVFGPVPKEKGKARTIAENRRDDLAKIWSSPTSTGLSTSNTLWTAFNAITEWIEHESITRTGNFSPAENRFASNLLAGGAHSLKEEAFTYALQLAGVK